MKSRLISPSLAEVKRVTSANFYKYQLMPISMELFADLKTPVEVLRSIRDKGGEGYIFESATDGESWGRFTFLGYSPQSEITGKDNKVTVREGAAEKVFEGNIHEILKNIVGGYKSIKTNGLPPFTGGFVGYFAYEYVKHVEPSLKLTDKDDIGVDDFRLMLFKNVIAFDNMKQKIHLIVNIECDNFRHLETNYIEGVSMLKDMEQLVLSAGFNTGSLRHKADNPEFVPSFTEKKFCNAVNRIKHYIHEGDIFQCVPSVRFSAPYKNDLIHAYRALRTSNPSAYMFYIHFDNLEIAGASPETLVSLKDGTVTTYPLAGTCRRGETDAETDELIKKLLNDEKELAEHDMLVDLGRNDIGKISQFGSVQVSEYRTIKKQSRVCHIASKVTGRISDHYQALDVMAAVLPAGTLSGAPKKRACEIINEIEGRKRGIYGGAVGYIDFTGNMDLCIAIRMAVLKDGKAHIQAGAGVVADSVPEKEYEECLRKAEAIKNALIRGAAAGEEIR